MKSPLTIFTLALLMLGFGVSSVVARPVLAQTFIQPPSSPVGGNSANWLTTGATDERKIGSLLIGSLTAPSSLCLNADVSEITNPATTKCISAWSQVISLAGGPFVPLRTSGLTALTQSDPAQYFVTPSATSLGASSIQATGVNQAYSLIAEANPDNNAGYGLFAGDGGQPTAFAAQFSGRVGIGNTILISGATGPVGQLCLNDTAAYVPNGAAGCIDAWGDLGGTLTGFVKLQQTNPPIPEAGTAAASDVGNFAAVIFGHPPTGQPAQTFCGDGLCSTHINEDQANPNYCPIDCVAPNPPGSFSVFSEDNTIINLQIGGQAQTPAGLIRLLLVRSTNPSFINDLRSGFVPQNGVVYTSGQVLNGVTVAYSSALNPSGFSFFDSGLTNNTTYYYRLYQANLFPIYNRSPLTTQGKPNP